ncbi:hypothetical protein PRIPAC_83467 [Pristionchus pacificus]|uniref:Uncharacterized protein n=1 Tax=Pristionchus pacificus TaxID=54126 RepID=A0A2A6CEQ0_PRIPA|nr:hypothetical protein PRIPAC_83467 [Pristionchus pacificus]|eukprot:PDM76567.1 hypothetical protein PRIPAC_42933 [Pristionchus pacificus]
MSSDSDFSDDDRKKKGKNKSMDSDDSGYAHKSKRRGKGKSSQIEESEDGFECIGKFRVMPSEANRKKKQKNTMEELQIKRREKEAKKASFAVDAVFGKKDSSSDSSSSNSSRSSSPSSRSTSRSRSRSAGPNKEDLAAKRPIAQVIDVVETAKVYNVESAKTNKGLKLRMGTEERNRSFPTMGEIHKKMKDIASPVELNYFNDEVNQLAESLRGEMARVMEGMREVRKRLTLYLSPSAASSTDATPAMIDKE